MTNPRPPAGPSTPTPPPGPKTDLTWLERHRLTARWDAAEEEQRATDSLREHARLGLPVEVEMARLKTARQAWDAVRGAS